MICKKILNLSFVLLIQVLSINFCQARVIAENFDNSIKLTDLMLQEWLKYNPKFQYYENKIQIESYFIQQALLKKRPQLDGEINAKIDFIHNRDVYQSAIKQIRKKLSGQVIIDEQEFINQFSELQTKNHSKKFKVRLYQIFKRYPPNATQSDKSKVMHLINSIRGKVTSLDDFKRMAIKESNAQSRLQKGLIGNVYNGQFAPSVDSIVMKMQAGELSQVIDLPNGLVLFYCEKIIPARHKTNKQLKEIVLNKMKLKQSTQKWQAYQQQLLNKLKPTYNWDMIRNIGNNQATVANTLLSQLSKQQLLWLLNGYNGKKSFSDFSNEEITSTVQTYYMNKNIFNNLTFDVQRDILSDNKPEYIERIISEIMVMLIKPRMVKVTEKDILSYYDTHKDKLLTKKTYDLSGLGLEVNKGNRKQIYKKIESIYYDVVTLHKSFDQAIDKSSSIEKKFPHINLNNLTDIRMSKIFGVRIANSIRVMQLGEVSDIIETSSGYLWIVRLNAILNPKMYQLSEVRQYISDKLNSQQANEWQDLISEKLLSKQKIRIFSQSKFNSD